MMRALLAGQKTQTRRPIRPLPVGVTTLDHRPWPADAAGRPITCRLATAGSTLWVREPWAFAPDGSARLYEADLGPAAAATRSWKGGRFLPRDASRMLLDVKEVRPERLDELTDDDARAEGMPPGLFDHLPTIWFRRLWDGIYGDGEFASSSNPWVWVICFSVRNA